MIIDTYTIEVQREGPNRKLVIQGRPYGLAMNIRELPQLEALALLLASEVGCWRDEQLDRDAKRVRAETKQL